MMEQTLLLIKPNAVKNHHVGQIISMIESKGYIIRNIQSFRFSKERAEEFYEMHKGKDFFARLIQFMISHTTVALLLEKNNAIEDLRELIGDADPDKQLPGTIRYIFANGVTENAVHASDSKENAKREIRLIFA
ncbi:MAG: nucleoside-diphosphate kinase [Candidatus Cloacimonetes bacterium]|nr:nucleoside-diphosphate kinase [Candidatus Cloacimonadota bacterium]